MTTDLLLVRIAVAFYVVATAFAFSTLAPRLRSIARWAPAAAGVGLMAHLGYLIQRGIAVGGIPLGDYRDLLSLLCWTAVLVYLLSLLRTRLDVLGVVILPLVLVLLFISDLLPAQFVTVSQTVERALLDFHIVIAVLGSGALFLTFAMSVVYLIQDRRLKEKRAVQATPRLPSLERCDAIVNLSLMWGFPLLTLTIVTGGIWSANAHSRYWNWERQEVFALLAWMILGLIISARLLRGWRGRKAALLTIVAFTALILRMLGVVF